MMKHYYETIGENWFSYNEFYKDIIGKMPHGANILEIGCWKGRSTACLGVEIINSGKDMHLFCVDAWAYVKTTEQPVSSQKMFNRVYFEFLKNIIPLKKTITVIRKKSVEASFLMPDEFFDFIFLDASHYYQDIKDDNNHWLPKLKKGGIFAGHDYFTPVHPGVKQAVDEVFGNNVKTIPEQNVWYYEK